MTPEERELVLTGLDDSRARLLAAVHGLSPAQLAHRPAADRWSVAECIEHIIVVETFVRDGLPGLVAQAPDASKRSAWEGQDVPLVDKVAGRANRRQAAEGARPSGRWPIETLAREFETARGRTRDLVAGLDGDLRSHVRLHPALGEIDAYQFILFIVGHCNRHCAQAEEVMATPGFPR
jgi:hypothetical protein